MIAIQPDISRAWAATPLLAVHTAGFWTILSLAVIGLALLLSAVVLRYRDRKRRAYIESLEQLNKAAAAIASSPPDMQPLLERLAEAARTLLQMPMSHILLTSDDPHVLVQYHNHGIADLNDRQTVAMADAPGAKVCLGTGRPLVLEDLARDPGPFDPQRMRRQRLGALIVLPLLVAEKPVGVMALADLKPRRFSEEQRRLASLIAAHVAVTIANARLYEGMNDAIRSFRKLQAQRDKLYTMSSAVQRAQSLDEALTRVAESAPSALEIDICVVCLAVDEHSREDGPLSDVMRVAAVTPLPYPFPVQVGMVDRCPKFSRLKKTGRSIAVADAQSDPALRERGLGAAANIGSVLYVPLLARRPGAIGVLVLMRRVKGPFSSEIIRMAEMFAGRAATAIDSTRLHDQTKRDADTKATLLHELNHRVKNNLASLIGLLSMGTPPLSSEAQHWLERVIDRISALSRTHDLFSAGREVSLSELIDTALDSIITMKPDDVSVLTEIAPEADIVLRAPRAAAMAMVVYELAYNAMVHGVGDGGSLEVRVRMPDADHIAIDVIDDGGGEMLASAATASSTDHAATAGTQTAPAPRPPVLHREGGVGLSLVRGLVSRELRGSFSVGGNDRGGTTATIVCPIELN